MHSAQCCSRHWRALLWLIAPFLCNPVQAIEQGTVTGFNIRAQRALTNTLGMEAAITVRANEMFAEHEREIADLRLVRDFASNELSAGYNYQFDRNGQPGAEHRLWQQFKHQFLFDHLFLDSSVRLEERYFTVGHNTGNRLRVLNRWSMPLSSGNLWRFGYEWVMNLDTLSAGTHRGISQNRLISGIQHPLPGGKRIELEYQLRYQHIVGNDNRIQHQFQLSYAFSL